MLQTVQDNWANCECALIKLINGILFRCLQLKCLVKLIKMFSFFASILSICVHFLKLR